MQASVTQRHRRNRPFYSRQETTGSRPRSIKFKVCRFEEAANLGTNPYFNNLVLSMSTARAPAWLHFAVSFGQSAQHCRGSNSSARKGEAEWLPLPAAHRKSLIAEGTGVNKYPKSLVVLSGHESVEAGAQASSIVRAAARAFRRSSKEAAGQCGALTAA